MQIRMLVAALAAAVMTCAPAAAQKVSTLPPAATLAGAETTPIVQAGQTRAARVDAIAAVGSTTFGRTIVAQADAAAARAALGGVAWAACKSGAAVGVTGTTAETTQAACSLPAGAAGPNGLVEVVLFFSFTGSANAKALRVRLGGSEVYLATISATTTVGQRVVLGISGAGSQSAQVTAAAPSGVGALQSTQIYRTNVNTANPTALMITCQLASTSETCTLESYLVRITYGA